MSKNKANIWGLHAVRAAWQNRSRQINAVYVSENAWHEFSVFQAVTGARRPSPQQVNKRELDRMTNGAAHQGIALYAEPLPETFLSDLLIKAQTIPRSLLVMLDQVTDPQNVGAIMRSACAFGAAGMVLQKKHAPLLEGALAKTACGALEHVLVAHETNLSRAIETLQEGGFAVIGLDERGEREIGVCKELGNHIVLVLGAEGPGLRPNVAKHCDALARLEMHGPMPSINVSNAAAVAMYALTSA